MLSHFRNHVLKLYNTKFVENSYCYFYLFNDYLEYPKYSDTTWKSPSMLMKSCYICNKTEIYLLNSQLSVRCLLLHKLVYCEYSTESPVRQLLLFSYVCLFVLRCYCPVKPLRSCWAVSLPSHTFSPWSLSPLSGQLVLVLILSPERDKCPSWISRRERMTIENLSWSISTKECSLTRRGLNLRLPDLQSDAHPNEPPRPALSMHHLLMIIFLKTWQKGFRDKGINLYHVRRPVSQYEFCSQIDERKLQDDKAK